MIRRFLARWADQTLAKRVLTLEAQLEAEQLRVKVLETERDTMALVIARDRARVQAESAAYSRARADHEGTPDVIR